MNGPLLAIQLAGHVVLLLWGMRAVQRGVERAFGSDLRRVLGRALRNRLVAAGAGAGVTMLLQSSTATAMMVTSFAARGAVDLVPALAVMLGANVGTALIVKALSFDVSWLSPLLMLVGYLAQKRAPKGRWRELGRVGLGLGLVLLALHLLVETLQPSGSAQAPGATMSALLHDPASRGLVASLTSDPLVDLLVAALLTFAAHSSIAVVLLLASLAGTTDVLSPIAAAAFVLGANVGGALPPLVETSGANPANRRLPAGNLLIRAAGCLLALPVLGPVTTLIWSREPPGSAVITFHVAFNVVLAVAAMGLLGPVRNLLATLLPEKVKAAAEPARPAFLDPEAQDTPYLALTNAAREILRLGDLVDGLLRLMGNAMSRPDKALADQARVRGRELDMLHVAVKAYLSGLERSELTERDLTRLSDLLEFAINLGHAGDIVERWIVQACTGHERAIDDPDREAAAALHARVTSNLKLAMSTMMTEDERSARQLLDAKRAMNEQERLATRAHLARLGGGVDREALAASDTFLLTLRDLKLVNSHPASIAYAALTPSERHPPDASLTLQKLTG